MNSCACFPYDATPVDHGYMNLDIKQRMIDVCLQHGLEKSSSSHLCPLRLKLGIEPKPTLFLITTLLLGEVGNIYMSGTSCRSIAHLECVIHFNLFKLPPSENLERSRRAYSKCGHI